MEGSRPATEGDLPRLVALLEAATAELRAMRGGDVWAACRTSDIEPSDQLLGALADPDQLVLAGTIDRVVVGVARARVHTLPDGRLLGVVDDLFVEEEARQVGVGEAMMHDLLAWCRERGCSGVDTVALPGHRSSKNFFEESGFTARLLVMHRPLQGEEGG